MTGTTGLADTHGRFLALRPDFPAFDPLAALARIRTEADWVGLRYVQEITHSRAVRNQRPERNAVVIERGILVETLVEGQIAYAGTSDLSAAAITAAARRAAALAKASARWKVFPFSTALRPRRGAVSKARARWRWMGRASPSSPSISSRPAGTSGFPTGL